MDYIRRIINNANDGGAHVLPETGRGGKKHHQQQEACATSLMATTTHLDDDDDNNATMVGSPGFLTQVRFTMEAASEQFTFLPDYTEHPKPKRRPRKQPTQPDADADDGAVGGGEKAPIPPSTPPQPEVVEDDGEITFFDDFVAGGVAGCASVIVGHPFDT